MGSLTDGYTPEQPYTPGLRIGDRVRSLVEDVNVQPGLEGVVTNTMPARPGLATRARIAWVNATISIAAADTFEVLPRVAA